MYVKIVSNVNTLKLSYVRIHIPSRVFTCLPCLQLANLEVGNENLPLLQDASFIPCTSTEFYACSDLIHNGKIPFLGCLLCLFNRT